MNLGIRAHDFENRPLEELVKAIAGKGLTSVQLALSKSFDINILLEETKEPFVIESMVFLTKKYEQA